MRGVVVPLGNARYVAYLTPLGAVRAVLRKGAPAGRGALTGNPNLLFFQWEHNAQPLRQEVHWNPLSPCRVRGEVSDAAGTLALEATWQGEGDLALSWELRGRHGGVFGLVWDIAPRERGEWGMGAFVTSNWRVSVHFGAIEGGMPFVEALSRVSRARREDAPVARFGWRGRVKGVARGSFVLRFSHTAQGAETDFREERAIPVEALASRLELLRVPHLTRSMAHFAQSVLISHISPQGFVVEPFQGSVALIAGAHAAALLWQDRRYTLARRVADAVAGELAAREEWGEEALVAFAHLGKYARISGNRAVCEVLAQLARKRLLSLEVKEGRNGVARAAHHAAAFHAAAWCAACERDEAAAHEFAQRRDSAYAAFCRAFSSEPFPIETLPLSRWIDLGLTGGIPQDYPPAWGALARVAHEAPSVEAAALSRVLQVSERARACLLHLTLLSGDTTPVLSLDAARWILEVALFLLSRDAQKDFTSDRFVHSLAEA